MFTIHCPQEDAIVLLGARRVRRLEHTPAGLVVHWTCHCGAVGRNAPTGRAAVPPAPVPASPRHAA